MRRHANDLGIAELDAAAVGPGKPGEHHEKRRLARTRWPEQRYELATADVEIDGIEGALDKMRKIVPHIAVWWSSGAHAAINFNQGQIAMDCYYVPKGAPNKDMAMKLIGEMTKPIYQANLTKYIA